MAKNLELFTISKGESLLSALERINSNTKGFLVVLDSGGKVFGTLTDGDIRRAIIADISVEALVSVVAKRDFTYLNSTDQMVDAIPYFKNEAVKFLPILDEDGRLYNIITRAQLHVLMLQDIRADLGYDFLSLDEQLVEHEIFNRPWGFYKTTVMNDYFQSKIICVYPGGQLSLQSHNRREEHWIVAHGTGIVQLDESILPVHCGSSVFIPKGCKHRLTNTDERESLIITEVQLGDYFGEDDIHRYDDIYGRVSEGD